MKAKTLSESEIRNRRPVWLVISELFLDTNLGSSDLERIAKELARSPYSVEDLERILLWEIYPACRSNLLSIAGEWAGFDPDWLESRILRGPSALGKAWAGTVGRLGRFSSIAWRRIKRRVEAQRNSASQMRGA